MSEGAEVDGISWVRRGIRSL